MEIFGYFGNLVADPRRVFAGPQRGQILLFSPKSVRVGDCRPLLSHELSPLPQTGNPGSATATNKTQYFTEL